MTADVIRLALVGIGKIARDQHQPALSAHPGFRIVATVSHHGSLPDVPAFDSMEALRDAQIEVDAVSICTPPTHRHALARQAVAAGWHIMLEKPPTATLSEVAELQARTNRTRLSLFTTWHSREADCVDAARHWLSTREIRSGQITWKEDIRRWHPGQHWILGPGGFGVFDPGINALSILTHILPLSLALRAATLHVPNNQQAPIAADLELSAANGARVQVSMDFLQTGLQRWEIEIQTDRGHLLLSEGGQRLHIDGELQKVGANREYQRLYTRFAELIRSGKSDVDVTPLQLVADAFLAGRRVTTSAFDF